MTDTKPMPKFNGARILVVGGAGFVGSNLVHRLLADNPQQVVVVDNLLSADRVNVPDDKRVTFLEAPITDDKVLRELPDNLDVAFHLACFHGNQSSIADPIADHANNTLTSLKLFERLKDIKSLSKVVYAAAGCAVAKKTRDEPAATSEDADVELFHDSPYSISKLVGEMYGNYYFRRHKMPFAKARFQNVYGPREILGAGRWRGTPHTVWRNVTPTFVFKALHGEALPLINGGEDGRDFIFVDDLVEGLMRIAAYGQSGEAYNVASGRETRIRDLASQINALAGNPTPPKVDPPRDWDNSGRRFGDPTKSLENLSFSANTPLERGLAATVDWTRKNLDVIKQRMAQHAMHVPDVSKYL
jgi:nucleoside-diphosphate-sugar epimerase